MLRYLAITLLVLALAACGGVGTQSDNANWDSGKWDSAKWQ